MYMQYIRHSKGYRSQNFSRKCLQYPCQQLEDMRSLCKVNSHMLNDYQRAMHLLLTIIHLQHGRNEDNAFLHCILTTDESQMHSFDPQMKWQNAEWHTTNLSRKKTAHHSLGALEVMHVTFFSQNGLVLDHPVPVGTTVNGQYYCSLLQYKERPALQSKQLKLLQCDVILLQNKVNPVQCRGWEMLAHFFLLYRSRAVWLLFVCMCRIIFGENNLNWKMIPTLLSLTLHNVWARMNTDLQTDHLPCRREKCVNKPGNYNV